MEFFDDIKNGCKKIDVKADQNNNNNNNNNTNDDDDDDKLWIKG